MLSLSFVKILPCSRWRGRCPGFISVSKQHCGHCLSLCFFSFTGQRELFGTWHNYSSTYHVRPFCLNHASLSGASLRGFYASQSHPRLFWHCHYAAIRRSAPMAKTVSSFLSGIILFPMTEHASRSVTEVGQHFFVLNLNFPNRTLSCMISNFIASELASYFPTALLTEIVGIKCQQMNPSWASRPSRRNETQKLGCQ